MLGKFKFPVLGEGERNVILECCGKRIQGVVFIISSVSTGVSQEAAETLQDRDS